jgi:hypothetical protein
MRYLDVVVGLVGKTDRAVETLIGIVISKADLQLDCLHELALLAGGEQFGDSLLQEVRVDFTH